MAKIISGNNLPDLNVEVEPDPAEILVFADREELLKACGPEVVEMVEQHLAGKGLRLGMKQEELPAGFHVWNQPDFQEPTLKEIISFLGDGMHSGFLHALIAIEIRRR